MLKLIDQIVTRTDANEALAICVVVHTHGSTPQKTGAMMLVLQDGQSLGTLGGGCVEAEVRKQALELISVKQDRLLRFKLNHDYGWDDGLVCGGTMTMAIMIVHDISSAQSWYGAKQSLDAGQTAAIGLNVPNEDGTMESFVHRIDPTPRMVIAGGGHVGQKLAAIARELDFELVVIDDRADYASTNRFPGAECIVGDIENELSRLNVTPHTYIVIVTRGHKHDASALAAVIKSPAKYIGLIGSKRKIITIYRELLAMGISHEQLANVHAPIGLDLAAITPAEIAVSIAAELIAIRRGKVDENISPMRITREKLRDALDSH